MTTPVASFDLSDGSRLTIYQNRVVHEGGGMLETVPLAHLASVRVAFDRDARKLNWAVLLLVVALVFLVVSGPLLGWSTSTAARVAENARRESFDAVLLASFDVVAGIARLLPWLAALLGAIAAGLAVVFFLGGTVLTLNFAAVGRAFVVRGRNRQLVEFAEAIGEQLALRAK